MQANWIKFDLISHPQSPRLAHIYDYNNCYSVCLSQVGLLYMCTRLIVNLSQVYLSMYLTESLNLCKVSHSSRQGSLLILAHRHYGDQCFFVYCCDYPKIASNSCGLLSPLTGHAPETSQREATPM